MADGQMTTVRDNFFEVLRATGMTTVFSNPGSTEIPLIAGWPCDVEFVCRRLARRSQIGRRHPLPPRRRGRWLRLEAVGRFILGLGVANPVIAAWHGDTFVQPMKHDLVDEYRLRIDPVVLATATPFRRWDHPDRSRPHRHEDGGSGVVELVA